MVELKKTISVDALYSEYEQFHDSDFKFIGESHNFWELIYVIEGNLGVSVGNRIYELTEGNAIFIAPMQFHSTYSINGQGNHLIILSFSLSGEGFDSLSSGIYEVGVTEDRLIRSAHEAAKIALEFEDSRKNQRVANNLEALILNFLEKQSPITAQKKTPGTDKYKSIIQVMTDNVDKNLSSEEIAELCGLGLSNLKRIVKKYSGVGVMQYYNNLRILKAMEMIQAGGKSIQEISETLNFSSQNYFTEVFKRQCNFTPSGYKRNFSKS